MNYQIADAKTRYFNDKEHYLQFLQAWKKAAQRSAHKGEDWGYLADVRLTGAHMVMYALLRGRDIRTAFTPITKKSKLENGFYINHGMYWAADNLNSILNPEGWNHEERIAKFLAPFGDVLDKEVLHKLYDDMPRVEPLYSNYGKGMKIAEVLMGIDKGWDNKELWRVIEKEAA